MKCEKKSPWQRFARGIVFCRLIATAAAATTAATATTVTTAAATTAATATGAAIFAGPSFVDGQLTAVDVLVVQRLDGRLGLIGATHLHETEALGAAGVAVDDDLNGLDCSMRAEQVLQIGV